MASSPHRRSRASHASSFASGFHPPPSAEKPAPPPHRRSSDEAPPPRREDRPRDAFMGQRGGAPRVSRLKKRRRTRDGGGGFPEGDRRNGGNSATGPRHPPLPPSSACASQTYGSEHGSERHEVEGGWGSNYLGVGSGAPPPPPDPTQSSASPAESQCDDTCGTQSPHSQPRHASHSQHHRQHLPYPQYWDVPQGQPGQGSGVGVGVGEPWPLLTADPSQLSQSQSYYADMRERLDARHVPGEQWRVGRDSGAPDGAVPPGRRRKIRKAKNRRKRHALPGPAGVWFQLQNAGGGEEEKAGDSAEKEDGGTEEVRGSPEETQAEESRAETTQASSSAGGASGSPRSATALGPAWDAMCVSLDRYLKPPSFVSAQQTYDLVRRLVPPHFTLLYEISTGRCDALTVPHIVVCVHAVHCHGHCDWTVELRDETTVTTGRGEGGEGFGGSCGRGGGSGVTGWVEERFVRDRPEWVRPGAVWYLRDVSAAVFPADDEDEGGGDDALAAPSIRCPSSASGAASSAAVTPEKMLLVGEATVAYAWTPEENALLDADFLDLVEQRANAASACAVDTAEDKVAEEEMRRDEGGDCHDEREDGAPVSLPSIRCSPSRRGSPSVRRGSDDWPAPPQPPPSLDGSVRPLAAPRQDAPPSGSPSVLERGVVRDGETQETPTAIAAPSAAASASLSPAALPRRPATPSGSPSEGSDGGTHRGEGDAREALTFLATLSTSAETSPQRPEKDVGPTQDTVGTAATNMTVSTVDLTSVRMDGKDPPTAGAEAAAVAAAMSAEVTPAPGCEENGEGAREKISDLGASGHRLATKPAAAINPFAAFAAGSRRGRLVTPRPEAAAAATVSGRQVDGGSRRPPFSADGGACVSETPLKGSGGLRSTAAGSADEASARVAGGGGPCKEGPCGVLGSSDCGDEGAEEEPRTILTAAAFRRVGAGLTASPPTPKPALGARSPAAKPGADAASEPAADAALPGSGGREGRKSVDDGGPACAANGGNGAAVRENLGSLAPLSSPTPLPRDSEERLRTPLASPTLGATGLAPLAPSTPAAMSPAGNGGIGGGGRGLRKQVSPIRNPYARKSGGGGGGGTSPASRIPSETSGAGGGEMASRDLWPADRDKVPRRRVIEPPGGVARDGAVPSWGGATASPPNPRPHASSVRENPYSKRGGLGAGVASPISEKPYSKRGGLGPGVASPLPPPLLRGSRLDPLSAGGSATGGDGGSGRTTKIGGATSATPWAGAVPPRPLDAQTGSGSDTQKMFAAQLARPSTALIGDRRQESECVVRPSLSPLRMSCAGGVGSSDPLLENDNDDNEDSDDELESGPIAGLSAAFREGVCQDWRSAAGGKFPGGGERERVAPTEQHHGERSILNSCSLHGPLETEKRAKANDTKITKGGAVTGPGGSYGGDQLAGGKTAPFGNMSIFNGIELCDLSEEDDD